MAIARTGSLAGAAASLRASEVTVGRHLASLEAALALRLFDRLPNRLRLTSEGERMVLAAEAMAEAANGVARLAKAAAADPAAPIRITSTSSVGLFLVRHLATLLAAAACAPLELLVTRETLDLGHWQADIALRMRRPPERGQLMVRRLGRITFAPYVTAGFGAQAGIIGLRDDAGSRQARWLASFQPDARMTVRLSDVHLRLEAILDGRGIGLLPCFLGDDDPRLARAAPPPPELEEDVFLLVHQDLVELPGVRAVMDALVRLFRTEAAILRGQPRNDAKTTRQPGP